MHSLASSIRKLTTFSLTKLSPYTLRLVLVAYAVLTIIFTYPVALNILTQPAGSTDVYEYMWELWWTKTSLIDLHTSPANVTALYHPYGTHHPILLLDAYLILTSLPLVILFGPIAAVNGHVLSSYVLTGFTTYLLCYSLTKKHWPSFVGGVIFAFSPFRADRAAHGVISMALTYWLPLYVLFLLKLFNRPSGRRALFCGISLGFAILSSFLHLVHFVIPITVVFIVYQHFADRRSLYSLRFLKNFGLALVLAGVMIIPFYLPLLKARIGGELDYFSRFGILGHSAALLSFVVPPSFQFLVRQIEPLWMLVQQLLPGRYYVVYLGVVPLALATCGSVNKRTRMWTILGLVSAVLALGPLLHIGGDLMEYSVADKSGYVLLPGALLTELPFYEWARSPARFGELTIFSVAVLASYGVIALSRISKRQMARLVTAGGVLVFILLDYTLYSPFPVQAVPIPEFYQNLSADSVDYGILDVGNERFNHEGMYFQTIHQRPIVRGFIYRFPAGSAYYQNFIEQLVKPERDIISADELVSTLNQLDIRYVVLHKLSDTTTEEFMPFLGQGFGPPVFEDEQIAAFAVSSIDIVEAQEIPLLMLGEQWHPIESGDEVPFRWMVNDGMTYVRVETESPYQLALVVHPFREPRHLQIFVDEELVEEYHVGGLQSYVTSPFVLKGGEWTPIRFHVPEGCEVPSEVMDEPGDDRCLSMLFQLIEVSALPSD
jgi:hypothetical protein